MLDSLKINRSDTKIYNYEGPKCKAILKVLPAFKALVAPPVRKYIHVLEEFVKVKDACFSHKLDPNTRQIIKQFENTWKAAGLDMIPKVHILFEHVAEFCEKRGVGLAIYSEQASETVHIKFKDDKVLTVF